MPSHPQDPSHRPPVIDAVTIGRGLVDEAYVHIIGIAFGNGCTLSLHYFRSGASWRGYDEGGGGRRSGTGRVTRPDREATVS